MIETRAYAETTPSTPTPQPRQHKLRAHKLPTPQKHASKHENPVEGPPILNPQIVEPPPPHQSMHTKKTLHLSYAPGFYPLDATCEDPSTPAQITTGLGRGRHRNTPAWMTREVDSRMTQEATSQNAPNKTEEYKAKETTPPPTVLSKRETCASCKMEDDPQNMIFCQECYKPIHQGCARKLNGYQICFPCRRAKTLEAAKYTDNK